jgi:hypothetical protein
MLYKYSDETLALREIDIPNYLFFIILFIYLLFINTKNFKELIHADLLNRSPMNERLKDNILLVLERVDEAMLKFDKLSADLAIPSRFDSDATVRSQVLHVGSVIPSPV